nr:hypothetical protein BaRGS_018551 [Batillaria attramentaria]
MATSPTSLTVPQWYSSSGGADLWRRVSSTSSSIFDLSAECDQLERAIRDNDVQTVKKFLQIHHGKFPVDLAASFLDKSSCDSRRHSHVSQDVEILLLKSQTLIESLGRKESVATESDVPYIFRTSLHLAVQHSAYDVLKLLLKFGVDPNEPSGHVNFGPPGSRSRRASSVNPEVLMHHLQQMHIQRQLLLQQQRQQQQQQDTISWDRRSRLSCCSQLSEMVESTGGLPEDHSAGVAPTPGASGLRGSVSRLQLPEIVETESECCSSGSAFDIAATYSGPGGDDLLVLPPLFTAVLEGRARAVRLLLRYGACPHVTDRHGCTPLHLACTPEFLSPECVYLLLRAGAKVNVANCAGVTPYLLYPKVVEEQRNLVSTALSRIPQSAAVTKKSTGSHFVSINK